MNEDHPVRFSVDYPDRPLDRLTTFFRIFTAIPIAIVLGTIGGYSGGGYDGNGGCDIRGRRLRPAVPAPALMIVFRRSTRAGGTTGISSCCASPIVSGPTSR